METQRRFTVTAPNPLPTRLGDVTLQFEPSLIIAQTQPLPRDWAPTIAFIVGVICALLALVTLSTTALTLLVSVSSVSVLTSIWLSRRQTRRRSFVINFDTQTLRLDFTTPFRFLPRTLTLPLDGVSALDLLTQPDGRRCLTVTFTHGESLLTEALIADIAFEDEALELLLHLLRGAFALNITPPEAALDSFAGA